MSTPSETVNVIITGVGGQGNVLAARLLADAALASGFEVTVGDVYGLTQRGGAVASHVRWTTGEPLPPLIPRNALDVLVAFEPMEAIRILTQFGCEKTAAIVNETRTLYGLSATDAGGTNESCVPKLPDGSCGDLWEMLKWEKRHETQWTGVAGGNWWFDGRGWGDLWIDTPLQLPIPCQELHLMHLLPCNGYGGPGGPMGSAGSSYNFPFEESYQFSSKK